MAIHEGSRMIGDNTIVNNCGTVVTYDLQDDQILVTLEDDEQDDELPVYAQDIRVLLGVTTPCGDCVTGPFNGSEKSPGTCAHYTSTGPDPWELLRDLELCVRKYLLTQPTSYFNIEHRVRMDSAHGNAFHALKYHDKRGGK
jgi:hypothetical protein